MLVRTLAQMQAMVSIYLPLYSHNVLTHRTAGFDHFSIENWYAPDEESRDAIEKLAREGYTVNPIPAYDSNGDLLIPRHYSRLSGALVRVKFHITHQYLRSKRTDNFYGEIQEIWILKDAPKSLTSPSKRRLLQDMKLANKRKRAN